MSEGLFVLCALVGRAVLWVVLYVASKKVAES